MPALSYCLDYILFACTLLGEEATRKGFNFSRPVRDSSCDPLDPLSYARAHRRHFKISGAKRINHICTCTYPYIHINVPTRVPNSGDGPCFLPLNIHRVLVHALQVTKRKDFDTGVQVCTLLCTE